MGISSRHLRILGAAAGVLVLGAGVLGTAALAAHAKPLTRRTCRTVTERVRVTAHAAPLLARVVHTRTTRTIRVRVCRTVVVGTTARRHSVRVVHHPAPSTAVHISTQALSAVRLSVPTTSGAPLSLGVTLGSSPFDGMAELQGYAAMVGAAPREMMWYRQWNEPLITGGEVQATAQRGITPIITWEPMDPNNTADPSYALAQIASGGWDSYITQSAQAAAATGTPFLVNFAPEMNGAWEPWGPAQFGNTPAAFVAAYRHVVDLFRAAGATNVGWIWDPNADWEAGRVYASYYPGDAYVDWVGMDGYNWGTTTSDGWLTPVQVFGPAYAALRSLAAKPIIIEETGSTEQGGSKADWIDQLASTVPVQFPAVRAVVWFQRNKETDWRVNSSAGALAAFQALAQSPQWAGGPMAVHPAG